MTEKKLYIIVASVILPLLLGFNIWQVMRYNKIEDSFGKLYNINESYKTYIKKNFVPIEINNPSIFSYIEECASPYADALQYTYVAYISNSVCMSCLTSLYMGMKEVGVDTRNIVFISAIHDIQQKREASSFGYNNFVFDESKKLSSILSSDVILFKINQSTRYIDYIRYDDNSQPVLELFVQ